MLTESPFEFFADCVGICLIVAFSFGVSTDIEAAVHSIRAWLHG